MCYELDLKIRSVHYFLLAIKEKVNRVFCQPWTKKSLKYINSFEIFIPCALFWLWLSCKYRLNIRIFIKSATSTTLPIFSLKHNILMRRELLWPRRLIQEHGQFVMAASMLDIVECWLKHGNNVMTVFGK